jgi:hypothetical protein
MKPAFCNRGTGLSYTDPSQYKNFVFKDNDLSKAGFRRLIPWKGEWHTAHICKNCGVYTIEYSQAYTRKEVEALIGGMKKEHGHIQS